MNGERLARRWGYGDSIGRFLEADAESIFGSIASTSAFADETTQKVAWMAQIDLLKSTLSALGSVDGAVYFEYAIPRLGGRIDVVLLVGHVLFVLEFKVGAATFTRDAVDQVWDYALDLKHFHEPSHALPIVPVLVATDAKQVPAAIEVTAHRDHLSRPLLCGSIGLERAIDLGLAFFSGPPIDRAHWERGRYRPTPTIVEAARALYAGHAVEDISRYDAGAENLAVTSRRLGEIIEQARAHGRKAVCFVTGVPGAGKTLVGLDVANKHTDASDELYSVFLSGNGPLVSVLHEALARDRHQRARAENKPMRLGEARSAVKQFIQNVHHFRDDCLADLDPPVEHVALFDEAQRAWDLAQTARFMQAKKGRPGFDQSEPEFLISCLDRHPDWAVVVCLVGSGQEINTGEAGISEWLAAIRRRFQHWSVHLSPRLQEIEYHAKGELEALATRPRVHWEDGLHLATSVRSFRSERVASFVNQLLALERAQAQDTLTQVLARFPIRLTRNLEQAKQWLRLQARGNERYGMVVSSQAQRLKPHAIDVRVKVDPVRWFLEDKEDVRSSYYLEDVATEFQVQGLELDWACVVWDGDLRIRGGEWDYFSFKGKRWERVRKAERRRYLLNAYWVLLTRARQGMVIVVPEGDEADVTRMPGFYDPLYRLLSEMGVPAL
ncbi:MAG: DUF2075 domain-containing protein [Rhodanobacteraceae bacterium]|nr:DUF2075 domain-containing protein [Rhodanobacteraceae bacterium]